MKRALVITCMDYRIKDSVIRSFLGNKGIEDIFYIRNAGNTFEGIERSIQAAVLNLKTTSIHIFAHTDCGAVQLMQARDEKFRETAEEVCACQGAVDELHNVKHTQILVDKLFADIPSSIYMYDSEAHVIEPII